MSKQRLSLYFDTDILSERKMWEYICKDGKNKKSRNVKNALQMIIEGVDFKIEPFEISTVKEEVKNEASKSEVIVTDGDEVLGDEDLPF